jgi:hypothetical protein
MLKTLRMSPVTASGMSGRLWSMEVVALMDAGAPRPGKRGPYKMKSCRLMPTKDSTGQAA